MIFEQKICQEIFEEKYMINGEENHEEVFRETAIVIAKAEEHDKRAKYEKEFYDLMTEKKFIPGGRIVANARTYSKMKNYNNCFTIDIEDSMESIYTAIKEDALISQSGGGVGFNISKLRPKGDKVSKGGESSGPISFLKVFNESAKIIKTGGQRRAAHIAILNIDHPDIEEFITIKKGDKTKVLDKFNISVGISDAFINAVENNLDWELKFNGNVYKTVKANYLFDLLAEHAFFNNEPGVFFLDNAEKHNNGWWAFVLDRTNPCGEICVSGDSKIHTDCGIMTIRELTSLIETYPDADVKTYSVNYEGHLELKKILFAAKTGVNKQTITIEFTNGNKLKVTPDHELFISATQKISALEYYRTWKSLSKRNIKRFEYPHIVYLNRSMRNGQYIKVKASTEENFISEHHFVLLGNTCPEGFCVHHKNENTLDNRVQNLEYMSFSEHSRMSNLGHDNYVAKKGNRKKDVYLSLDNSKFESAYTNAVKDVYYSSGLEDVYDLTVKDNHNFFANGMLVHNCMPSYSLCCLGAINLTKFVTDPFTNRANIYWGDFEEAIRTGIRFLDNVLDVTDYPLKKIKDFSQQWRRIGLGVTGLGDVFAMMRIKYGSLESLELTEKIFRTLRDQSYYASANLAKEKESFPACNIDKLLKANFIKDLPEDIKKIIKKYGLRNIGLNTCAPTGTISFSIGDNCSSGIEPIFDLSYTRDIRTGGEDTEVKTEKVYDYAWKKYIDKTYKDAEKDGITLEVPEYFDTTLSLDPMAAMEVQSVAQKYIDHSISKTYNLPANYKLEDYKKLWLTAHKKGLKGMTTFNPNGSMKGILKHQNEDGEIEIVRPEMIERHHAPKRPKDLECDIHVVNVKDETYLMLVGILNGSLYEIFATGIADVDENDRTLVYDVDGHKKGILRKNSKNSYSLVIKNGEEKEVIKNIRKTFNVDFETSCRLISMGLRHGVPLEFIVHQLAKHENMISLHKAVSRVLKKYIKEGEKYLLSQECPSCGSKNFVYSEGCILCKDCGWGQCS
jgi:ribonucleotide reductase alpha subunit